MEENCSIVDAPYIFDQNLLFLEDKIYFRESINYLTYYFKNMIMFFGIIITSFTGAVVLVSTTLLKNVKKEYKQIYEFDTEDEDYFCSEFLEEYDKMEERKLEDDDYKNIENKIVNLDTPDGFVIMGYNKIKEAFYYYSDSKDIFYYYLDVVARKFVVTYDCKSLLINSKDEFLKSIENYKILKEEKESCEEKETLVFANLKNSESGKEKVTVDSMLKIKDKEIPEPEKFNKYIYKGKLCDFNQFDEETSNDDFENVNYYYFKSTTVD